MYIKLAGYIARIGETEMQTKFYFEKTELRDCT